MSDDGFEILITFTLLIVIAIWACFVKIMCCIERKNLYKETDKEIAQELRNSIYERYKRMDRDNRRNQ